MSWGDSWGSTPCRNSLRLAKAFYEARPLGGNSKSRVEVNDCGLVEYRYNTAVIARYIYMPLWIAYRLTITWEPSLDEDLVALKFRSHWRDKGEARHLKALGVEAKWQYGGRPFLIEGAASAKEGWHTLEEWKAMPKWEPPSVLRKSQPDRFVNLTMPLFG